MEFFQQSTLGLQPLSIICDQSLATQVRQVSILHLMQLKPIFQHIVENNAQCVIQLKTSVSALHRLSNEHTVLLGSCNDKNIIMNIGVHLMSVAEMVRCMKREKVRQDLKDCSFPTLGTMRNTMTGDHLAVLRLLINAVEVPAEQSEYSPTPRAEVSAERSEDSQTPRAEVD